MAQNPNPFKVGDVVRRKRRTLGASEAKGVVRKIVQWGEHACLRVEFKSSGGPSRVETFIWSMYEHAKDDTQ